MRTTLQRFTSGRLGIAMVLLWAGLVSQVWGAPIQIGTPLKRSRVPSWDARGLGPLPWQGITCVDMTPDGRFIAVGTLAPSGDPQLFLLNEQGDVVEQYRVGERWINEVAVGQDGAFVAALCTTPAGTSGDIPLITVFAGGKILSAATEAANRAASGYAGLFHYGAHANILARQLCAVGDRLGIATTTGMAWITPATGAVAMTRLGKAGPGQFASCAVNAQGVAVFGRSVQERELAQEPADLCVLAAGQAEARWRRTAEAWAGPAAPAWSGVYGPPALPYTDQRVQAPLAVAVSADGGLVAAAEYPGWNRQFPRGDDYGRCFFPTRPAIRVYDAAGQVVRRLDPAAIPEAFWCELAFTTEGKRLLISPRSWTCRGLGGTGILPTDAPARTLYTLEIASGAVTSVTFPDAIAGVSVAGPERVVVSCWDQRVYLLDGQMRPIPGLKNGVPVGAAALVRASTDGARVLVAGVDGVVRLLDATGNVRWKTDLNAVATPGNKPWTKNQRLGVIAPGLWVKGGQRTHSDMGNQYVIEAPEGLLLIDPNSALSIEQNFAQMKAVGLDPMRVKYILLTHEHGDHAPGAYLWRIITGAQVIATPEMATCLQQHIPLASGYGFHPPQPVDRLVTKDEELTLAGMKVSVVRLPGHTYGSLGYAFTIGGKRYMATGDLIMPGGVLGYSGSIDFSGVLVLASLRKIATMKPEVILGGHGGGDPADFVASGIAAGEATGWGVMPPEKPNPLYRFATTNYQVAAWLQPISAAGYGDVNGDGMPDVVVLTREAKGAGVRVYLNKKGTIAEPPDLVQAVPELTPDTISKVRLVHLTDAKAADLVLTSEGQTVLLRAQPDKASYQVVPLPGLTRVTQVMSGDFTGDGRRDLLLGGRFVSNIALVPLGGNGAPRVMENFASKSSFGQCLIDVNGDTREDLITAMGEIFLRQPDGTLPKEPTRQLTLPTASTWVFLAAADFNGDSWPDLVLLVNDEKAGLSLAMYDHTRDPQQPYRAEADRCATLPGAFVSRDGPTVGDWNGDTRPDLIVQNAKGVLVIPGAADGLAVKEATAVPLDYTPFHDNQVYVADFTGDGKADLAGWGRTVTGAAGVYLWVHP